MKLQAASGREFLNLVCDTMGIDPKKRACGVEIKADLRGAVDVFIQLRATKEEAVAFANALTVPQPEIVEKQP